MSIVTCLSSICLSRPIFFQPVGVDPETYGNQIYAFVIFHTELFWIGSNNLLYCFHEMEVDESEEIGSSGQCSVRIM